MSLNGHLAGYPGRGLVLRTEQAGLRWVYFVTGRSPESRQRSISAHGDELLVSPMEGGRVDSLRHYACARLRGERLIVGNGDHVQYLATRLTAGDSVEHAWGNVIAEPDPPIRTPRIAAVVGHQPLLLSVRDQVGEPRREVSNVADTIGAVTVLTTYDGDVANPAGAAPQSVHTIDPDANLLDVVWDALDDTCRVTAVAGLGPSLDSVQIRR